MIDIQRGIVRLPPPDMARQMIENARILAAAFRRSELTVIAVNVGYAPDAADAPAGRCDVPPFRGPFPPDWAQLVDELEIQPSDVLVTKHQWNAFHRTPSLIRA